MARTKKKSASPNPQPPRVAAALRRLFARPECSQVHAYLDVLRALEPTARLMALSSALPNAQEFHGVIGAVVNGEDAVLESASAQLSALAATLRDALPDADRRVFGEFTDLAAWQMTCHAEAGYLLGLAVGLQLSPSVLAVAAGRRS